MVHYPLYTHNLSLVGVCVKRIGKARTQEKVWCQEQYNIACDAIKKGFRNEALGYLNNCIHGAPGHTGVVTEHRYHFLKARILLGMAGGGRLIPLSQVSLA